MNDAFHSVIHRRKQNLYVTKSKMLNGNKKYAQVRVHWYMENTV